MLVDNVPTPCESSAITQKRSSSAILELLFITIVHSNKSIDGI